MIYLNHAASSWPKAPGVVEAVSAALLAPPAHPGRDSGAREDARDLCRLAIAGLLGGVDPTRVVLTSGATQALNQAILGIDLPAGSLVVTSAAEHNSVLRPLRLRARRDGLSVVVVPVGPSGRIDGERCLEAIGRGARLLALTHGSNVTGQVNDAAPLFAAARRAGAATLLDASQSLGLVEVDPVRIGADMVAFTGHKALGGPPGTGGLYCAETVELSPVQVGGTGVRSELLDQPPEMPMRLEAGTPNVPGLAGLAAAVAAGAKTAPGTARRAGDLAGLLRDGLRRVEGVELVGAGVEPSPLGIVSFRIRGWEPAEVAFILERSFGIVCRAGLHCAPLVHRYIGSAPDGTVRFSVAPETSEAEVERAIAAVGQVSR